MSKTQNEINKKITQQFVKDNPISIVLTRKVKTATPDGGWTYSNPSTIPAQTFTLIKSAGSNSGLGLTSNVNEEGQVYSYSHVLVGENSDVQRYDTFVLNGKTYEVLQVTSTRDEWGVRAYVLEKYDAV